jgi:predicted membrane chloride channel (bestrophin family)
MPHPFDLGEVVDLARNAIEGIVGRDVRQIRGFSERQLKLLAKQAAWIAEARALGELDDEDYDGFLDRLEQMTRNFAETLRGLLLVTIEKIWNAVVDVLWGAIERVVGVPIPRIV